MKSLPALLLGAAAATLTLAATAAFAVPPPPLTNTAPVGLPRPRGPVNSGTLGNRPLPQMRPQNVPCHINQLGPQHYEVQFTPAVPSSGDLTWTIWQSCSGDVACSGGRRDSETNVMTAWWSGEDVRPNFTGLAARDSCSATFISHPVTHP